MTRPIYLLVYPSPLFPAHWALFVPHATQPPSQLPPPPSTQPATNPTPSLGKTLHASGSAISGFTLSIDRNFSLSPSSSSLKHTLIHLADIPSNYIVDVIGDGTPSSDLEAHDRIEEIALGVAAPGKSLVAIGGEGSGGKRRGRVQIRDCQSWVREVVGKLVEEGVCQEDVLGVLEKAPKN